MLSYKLDDFSVTSANNEGICTLCYKAIVPEIYGGYIKHFESSAKLCKLLDKSFIDFIDYVNKKLALSLEERVLSDQFQLNMNKKYGGKSPSQEDVAEFGLLMRQLQSKYKESCT